MVSYDISKVWSFLPTLVQALPATLALMVLTTVLGSAFGLVLTWAQVSEDKVGAGLAKGYVFTLRCTPPIVLLFLVFYGLPQFLNWWLGIDIDHWSKFVFVLVAMFLLFAAMISEVFKAAYYSLETYTAVAVIYWGIALVISFSAQLLEKRLSVTER